MAFEPNSELLDAMRSFTALVQGGGAAPTPTYDIVSSASVLRQPSVGVSMPSSPKAVPRYGTLYATPTTAPETSPTPENSALKTLAVVGVLGLGAWLLFR